MFKNPFRTRTRTVVDSQTVPFFEDDHTAPTIVESILKSILQKTSLTDELQQYVFSGPTFQFNQYYKNGKNRYIDGLPKSVSVDIESSMEDFRQYLRDLYNEPVDFGYASLGVLDFIHYTYRHLQNTQGYTGIDNRIGNLSTSLGADVYIDNIDIHVTPELLEESDASLFTWLVDSKSSKKSLQQFLPGPLRNRRSQNYKIIESNFNGTRVHYSYEVPVEGQITKELHEGYLDVSVPIQGVEEEDLGYFQAVIIGEDWVEYFSYELGSNGRPVLDSLFDPDIEEGNEHYPIALLIKNQTVVADLPNDDERRRSTRNLLNSINIDLQSLSDGIMDNEDASKIRQAALVVGCPLNAKEDVHKKYLFEYFRRYVLTTNTEALQGIYWKAADYECEMTHSGISIRTVASNTKDMEDYEVSTVNRTVTTTVTSHSEGSVNTVSVYRDTLCRKKISNVAYQEIRIRNPQFKVKVTSSRYASHDADSKHFLIPLEVALVKSFDTGTQKELLVKSLHLQVSILDTVRVKWYETQAFAVFLQIAAIALTIVTLGMAAPLVAAAFAVGFWAGMVVVAKIVLMAIAFRFAAEYAVEKWGPENAFLVTVAVMVASAFAPGGPVAIGGFPLANSYMAMSTNLMSAVGTAIDSYTAQMLKDGQQELTNLKSEFDTLKEIEDSFLPEPIDLFDEYGLVPMLIKGEDPDDFYNRTIHTSNIGVKAVEQLSNYVETALTLPDTKLTFMEKLNA